MADTINKDDKGKTKKPELTREIIRQIGEKLYQFKDVGLISIQAEFSDGSGIRFRKMEEEDE